MDDNDMKVISWVVLIGLMVGCFFLLKDLVEKHVITQESESLWLFYISAIVAFIMSLVIMHHLSEELEWNPFGAAFTSLVAFPVITALIAIAIAVILVIGVIYLIVKLAASGESEKKYRKIGEIDVWEED